MVTSRRLRPEVEAALRHPDLDPHGPENLDEYLQASPVAGGLDLHVRLGKELWPDLNNSSGPHQFVVDKIDEGELGLKSGKGFIDWTGQDPEEVLEARAETLVELIAKLGSIG